MIAQIARLHRAPRRVGLRIEVHEQLPSPVVLEPNGLLVLVQEAERRRGVSLGERAHVPTLGPRVRDDPTICRSANLRSIARSTQPSLGTTVGDGRDAI